MRNCLIHAGPGTGLTDQDIIIHDYPNIEEKIIMFVVFFFCNRLAFRSLVRLYDCDLAFTPMIVSESFVKSVKARDSDFTTNKSKY